MTQKNRKRVFVGVSGGVDSAVSAYLLKKAGYDVVGVFIKTWQPDFIECTWREERRDAIRVCASLDIPFMTLDLEKEYRDEVAYYMIDEYKKGRTPNPDVMCNKKIKFGAFYDFAISHGANYIATGHYARVGFDEEGRYRLLRGIDDAKDQSYFLWEITSEKLSHILFPIGEFPKSEVRKIAEKAGLSNAEKKDSQGVCFLGEINMKDFLSHYIPRVEGNVLSSEGEVIGSHDGALSFTIGERHGFTITKKGTDDEPLFVIAKDIEKNTIAVAPRSDSAQNKQTKNKHPEPVLIEIDGTNWISTKFPSLGKIYNAQIRYHGEIHLCSLLSIKGETATLAFEIEPFGVSSGQSIVLYDGDVCVGGGVIT